MIPTGAVYTREMWLDFPTFCCLGGDTGFGNRDGFLVFRLDDAGLLLPANREEAGVTVDVLTPPVRYGVWREAALRTLPKG